MPFYSLAPYLDKIYTRCRTPHLALCGPSGRFVAHSGPVTLPGANFQFWAICAYFRALCGPGGRVPGWPGAGGQVGPSRSGAGPGGRHLPVTVARLALAGGLARLACHRVPGAGRLVRWARLVRLSGGAPLFGLNLNRLTRAGGRARTRAHARAGAHTPALLALQPIMRPAN